MSFEQFFRVLWGRRGLILASLAGLVLVGLLAIVLIPQKYESKSRVMLDVVKPDPVTGQVLNNSFARIFFGTQAQLVKDYRVTGRVVDVLGWQQDPARVAAYQGRPSSDTRDMRRYLADQIAEATDPKVIEGSNILEITYTAGDAEGARRGADALRDAYIEESLELKQEKARQSAEWFDGQAGKIRDQLAAAESRKTKFERENNIVLQDGDTDTDTARLRALSVAGLGGSAGVVTPPPSQSTLQLAQVDAQIAQASELLGPNHPELQALKRQRAAIAQNAEKERSAALAAARAAAGPSIAGEVAAQRQRVIGQRDKLEALQRLNADVQVLRDQYVKTAARGADLRQEADSTDTNVTLLGNAVTPDDPVSPKVWLILIGSVVGGLVLGVGGALLLELMNRRVRSVDDLRVSGVPVVVVLSGEPRVDRTVLERLGWRGAAS